MSIFDSGYSRWANRLEEVDKMAAQDVGRGQDQPVDIELDGVAVTSPSRRRTGLEIRELGPAERVQGFETQEVNRQGKKIRTIRDDEDTELHHGEQFRTVPNEGGPGGIF